MPYPDNGFIEINDASVVMRGHLLAAGGTFSGKFRADNVGAIDRINIRDGSVAFHMLAYPDGPAYYFLPKATAPYFAAGGVYSTGKKISFSVEGSPYNSYVHVSAAISAFNVVVLLVMRRNGVVYKTYGIPTGMSGRADYFGEIFKGHMAINIFDWSPALLGVTDYEIELFYCTAKSAILTNPSEQTMDLYDMSSKFDYLAAYYANNSLVTLASQVNNPMYFVGPADVRVIRR